MRCNIRLDAAVSPSSSQSARIVWVFSSQILWTIAIKKKLSEIPWKKRHTDKRTYYALHWRFSCFLLIFVIQVELLVSNVLDWDGLERHFYDLRMIHHCRSVERRPLKLPAMVRLKSNLNERWVDMWFKNLSYPFLHDDRFCQVKFDRQNLWEHQPKETPEVYRYYF